MKQSKGRDQHASENVTPVTRRFIAPKTEVVSPGVIVHWASNRADRFAAEQDEAERKARFEFMRPTRRHPGLGCR